MRKALFVLVACMSLVGFSQNFALPEIPDDLTDESGRSEYLFLHYWDNYDFYNPQIFVDGDAALGYFYLMMDVSVETSNTSIKSTLARASQNNQVFSLFLDTYRVYLMNPQSYYCDYERYLAVCEFVINDERINKYAKFDFELEKTIILTNRVGEKATGFSVVDKNDIAIALDDIDSEYLLLFFNNPNCNICMQTKNDIANSEIINYLVDSGRLTVFAVCPYDEYDLWKATDYPDNWYNGFDKDQIINNEKLYYFLESSSIYLLDKDKKVLKKDIRIDMLEEYLKCI